MDMTALSVFELMPSTPDQVNSFASQIKQQLLNGAIDFKRLLYQKKFIENTLDALFGDEEVKKHLENEIEKYEGNKVGYNDVSFSLSGKKTYNYKGDPVWLAIDQQKKDREKFLKALKKPMQEVDAETGEVIEIFPATYTETTYIKSERSK